VPVPVGVNSNDPAHEDGLAQPSSDELDFVFNEIIEPGRFSVPAVITDSAMTFVAASRNVPLGDESGLPTPEDEARLLALVREMDRDNEPIPPVRTVRRDVPADVDAVLARATAKSPERRFGRVEEFVDAFLAALDAGVGRAASAAAARRGAATAMAHSPRPC
jgi:hypothetical protein